MGKCGSELLDRPQHKWDVAFTGVYENFEKITRLSLEHAASEAGYPLKENTVEEIIKAYDRLTVLAKISISTLDLFNSVEGSRMCPLL